MTAAIPVSQIVTVNPGVVGTGGNPLALNCVMLTENALQPTGNVLQFSTAAEVGDYFGLTSTEYKAASVYFNGFDNSTKKPGTLYFAKYNTADVAAWLRGSTLSGMTLAQLQAISGTLTVTIDGVAKTAASLNLSAVASFSAAATAIGTALSLAGGETCTWDATYSQFVITSGTTGATSTITMGSGTTAAALGLASGTLSQGGAIHTPAGAMTEIAELVLDWASFMTIFQPSNADAQLFAAWNQTQNDRYFYVAWDADVGNLVANNATVLGSLIAASTVDGTLVVYNTVYNAAFVAGYVASIDWNATNGRATVKFRQQAGLANYIDPIDTLTKANAILSNNATYYGTYTAPGLGNVYNIMSDGKMAGSRFKWVDTYVNQIFLNAQLQLAIFNGLLMVNSAPYNELGYTFIRSWCADPIRQALNNGTIRTGVPLSELQKAAISSAAGKDISNELVNQGYYLQVLPATAQTRGARQSPPVNLWYMDGGAIQQITLASIAVL